MTPNKAESLFSEWSPPDVCETRSSFKSETKYKATYENFMIWKNDKNISSFTEDVFLAYFKELALKYKPNSLSSIYSMLKSTVLTTNGVNLKKYYKLNDYLRNSLKGYKVNKVNTLSPTDVEKFLSEAPDHQYLATKVALIFGIAGGCKRMELQNITTNDIQDDGERLLVRVRSMIKKSRKNPNRIFAIHSPFYEIVKKYSDLRSKRAKDNRFFQNYQKGKCTIQPIGVNKLGSMPKEVARYLGLPDAESYTGHSYRRTADSLRAATSTQFDD